MTTKIQLKSEEAISDFTGYQLILLYQSNDEALAPTQVTIDVSKTGVGEFTYENNIQIHDKINISVKAAAGNIVLNKDVNKGLIIGQANLQVPFKLNQVISGSLFPDTIILKPTVINGRLLDSGGTRKMEEIQIIIYATLPNETDSKPILTTITEASGYFFVSYPEGEFKSANAVIAVGSSNNNIPITLETGTDGKKIFPRRLLLVLEAEPTQTTDTEKDCDCECNELDFHEQKRILEEFSFYSVIRTSDPEIKAYNIKEEEEVSMDDLVKISPTISFPIKQAIFLNPEKIGLSNQLHTPGLPIGTLAAAAAPASATITDDQVNSALKGIKIKKSVLNNFMAVHQQLNKDNFIKLIEMNDASKINAVIENDRFTNPGRTELNSGNQVKWDGKNVVEYQATSIAYGHLLHFKQQWVADGYSLGDLIYSLPLAPGQKKQIVTTHWRNKVSGSNSQQIAYGERLTNELSRDRDLNEIAAGVVNEHMSGSSTSTVDSASAGLGLAIGPLVLGASGGISKSSAKATQDSMRAASARDSQHLSDKTVQSASAVRNQRTTVIQTVSQGEDFEVTAESIANYNHCHAITIQYFEVLRHFKVQQRIVDARECLFVPLPISTFDIDKAIRWKEILNASLRDRSLRSAFDSMQRVKDRWEHSDLPDTTFAAEQVLTMTGALKVLIDINCPGDKLEEQVRKITTVMNGYTSTYDEKYTIPVFDLSKWEWMTTLGLGDPVNFYNAYLKDQSNKEEIFQKQLGQKIAQKIVDSFEFKIIDDNGIELPVPIDPSLTSTYYKGKPVGVSIRAGATNIPRQRFVYLKISLKAGLKLPEFTSILVKSGSANYRTKHRADRLFNLSVINDDLDTGDSVTLYCGPTQAELRNPKEDDIDITNRLIAHLNGHLEYFYTRMMMFMSAERRFMLLDGIKLPGTESQGRSVASLVENKLIGIVGNSMVLPVIPGLNLNPDFKPQIIDEFGTVRPLIDYYNHEPLDPLRVSVPTDGVFAEAMMGKCNSCEKKDEQRFWRWEESPIPDSPTAINPVNVPTPVAVQPNLQATPLANPIVNIQNAPAAPDPQGLSSLMNLLGKGDTFRDMAGLTQTQQNALAGLQASFAATESFGEKGLKLRQMENEKEIKLKELKAKMDAIKEGKANGTMSNEQAEQATTDAWNDAKTDPPPTTAQQIDDVNSKLASVNDMVQKGWITPEKGKEISAKLVSEGLSDMPKSSTEKAADLAEKMSGGLKSASVAADGSTTLEADDMKATSSGTPTLDPIFQNASREDRTFNPVRISVLGTVNTASSTSGSFNLVLANTLPGNIYGLDYSPKYRFSSNKLDHIRVTENPLSGNANFKVTGLVPGTYMLFATENNTTVGKAPICVPQYFLLQENKSSYQAASSSDITLPWKFDDALDAMGLLSEKDFILITAERIITRAFFTINIRTIWNTPPFNDKLFYDNLSDANYKKDCVSTIFLRGCEETEGVIGDTKLGSTDFNSNSRVYIGWLAKYFMKLGPAAHDNFPIVQVAHKFKDALDQLATAPTNQVLIDEFTRLKDLWIQVVARSFAFSISHEIGHSLLRAGEQGYDINEHEGFLMEGPMIDAQLPHFLETTGIEITNNTSFPDAGSFVFDIAKFDDKLMEIMWGGNAMGDFSRRLPTPPNVPFDI